MSSVAVFLTDCDKAHRAGQTREENAHGEKFLDIEGIGQPLEHPELAKSMQKGHLLVSARHSRSTMLFVL